MQNEPQTASGDICGTDGSGAQNDQERTRSTVDEYLTFLGY